MEKMKISLVSFTKKEICKDIENSYNKNSVPWANIYIIKADENQDSFFNFACSPEKNILIYFTLNVLNKLQKYI